MALPAAAGFFSFSYVFYGFLGFFMAVSSVGLRFFLSYVFYG